MIRVALAVLALCAAAAATAEEEKFEVVPHPALPGEVPAGSREDQVLWRDARDAMVQGNEAIRAANMALYDVHYARLNLEQLSKEASPADLDRLKALGGRLDAPVKEVDAVMPRGSLGRCRYESLYFEQSMGAEPGDELGQRLPQKREEARRCKADHQQVIATLGPAVKQLRAALDEVAPEIRQRMAARGMKAVPGTDGPKDSGALANDAAAATASPKL